MAQIARVMGRCTEARGLPRLATGTPASFSQTALAFVQARSAFEAFGKRHSYDGPVADAAGKAKMDK